MTSYGLGYHMKVLSSNFVKLVQLVYSWLLFPVSAEPETRIIALSAER